LEYVNLVTTTRLQVASQHLLITLQELVACAGWTDKFQALGLETAVLQDLLERTRDFARLTELLLLECGQARRFVRTLFQVLLRMAHRVAESGNGSESNAAIGLSPTKDDMDEFVSWIERRQSLELMEITERIGSARTAGVRAAVGSTCHAAAASPGLAAASSLAPPVSLFCAVAYLTDGASNVSEQIVATLSARCAPLASLPISAPSPWMAVGIPELQAAALATELSRCGSPSVTADSPGPCSNVNSCSLGGSTLSMAWESSQLFLLWSAASSSGAVEDVSELHIGRAFFPPAAPSTAVQPRLEKLRLRACSRGGKTSHFLLCQLYDSTRVVAMVLNEKASQNGGPRGAVCLVDISDCSFQEVSSLSTVTKGVLPPAVALCDLPDDAVRTSAPLPDGYVWASAMRAMSTRGVCSIYAQRARRLLTLDMEADADEDEDDHSDGQGT